MQSTRSFLGLKRNVFIILIGVVLVDYEIHAKRLGLCEEACCMDQKSTRSDQSLTEAFKRCCNESTRCVLPKKFYSLSCRKELMNFCVKNETNRSETTTDLTKTNLTSRLNNECCKNVNCSGNNTGTTENRAKCFKINVDWREVNFPPKLDRLIQKWNRESWIFFLKMASQMCLKNSTSPSIESSVEYRYPYYTKHEEKIVDGYQAPPALLIKRKECYTMFTVVGESFEKLWQTLVLCVTWSLISGVIIWLLDRRKNPTQFPSSFWEGVREGTWWAVVTMTTVGYGDKIPKSLPARIYSALWMIVGAIILSMFTAEVASGLTYKQVSRHESFLGAKIGVPYFSLSHFEEEIRGAKILEVVSKEHLVKYLRNGSEKMDKIILHCYKKQEKDIHPVRQLDKHFVGIYTNVIGPLVTCVKKMVKEHHDEFVINEETSECNRENSQAEKKEHRFERTVSHHLDLLNITLYASLGLVVVMLVAGSVWDLIKANNLLQIKKEADAVQGNCDVEIDVTNQAIRVTNEDGEVIQT